jgi:hypothetical protein
MTCQPAFSAVQTPRFNTAAPACYPSFPSTCEAASDTALITKVMHALNSLPPLVLTHAMQRDAFQKDHDRALRGNRANAGRIAQEAKKATTAVLSRICSGDAC